MKKHLSKIALGIPILLLLLVSFFGDNDTLTTAEEFNPYLHTLPDAYITGLNNTIISDSSYFSSIVEAITIRKLLVFKSHPNDKEVKTDFTVELYPTDKNHLQGNSKFLSFKIVDDAILFNHKNKTYGVFKLPLPMIDIDRIVVKSIVKKKNEDVWVSEIKTPFASIKELQPSSISEDYESAIKPMLFTSLFAKQLDHYEIKYLPSSLNERNNEVFRFFKPLNNFITTNKFSLVKVKNQKTFWNKFNIKDKALLEDIELIDDSSNEIQQLFDTYLNEDVSFEDIFDTEKLAFYNALKPVFAENCAKEQYFLYNKKTSILEPFHAISDCSKENTLRYLNAPEIEDVNYLQAYAAALNEVSRVNLYERVISNNNEFKNELILINKYDTNHIFDFDIIKANQRVLGKSLNPSSALKTELISMDNEKMMLSVFNTSNYPIKILGLSHNNKKIISKLSPIIQVNRIQTDTIIIDLPRSFENLFVSKKKKATGFILPKHIYELNVQYQTLGVNKIYASSIIPYQKNSTIADDLFRTPAYINNHRFIVVNNEKKEITFSKDSVSISSPIVIPKNYTFKLGPGAIVNIIEGGKIVSHSPLSFIGSKENPIKIYSSDKRGQGVLVLSEHKKSILKHVVFDRLRNPTHGSWGITGAVTFYESPVDLNYVVIKNNKCEDALNVVRAKFLMQNVTISNTQSDAFDGDFAEGSIINCQFNNLGNDAIDVSGSDLTIKNVVVSNAGDKAFSAGENSRMNLDTVEISNSEIAIAGKDLSVVDIRNLKISNTKLGFTAFQKKPEFGPSKITVNGILMTDIETKYLIESSSSLFVDNKKIETTQNVKDRMYGVEFGRSSDETRNTPQ